MDRGRWIDVGDWVQVGGIPGQVEEIRGDMLLIRLQADLERRQMPQTQRRWFHMSQVGRKLPKPTTKEEKEEVK